MENEQKIIDDLMKHDLCNRKPLGYFCKKYNIDAWTALDLYGKGLEQKNLGGAEVG